MWRKEKDTEREWVKEREQPHALKNSGWQENRWAQKPTRLLAPLVASRKHIEMWDGRVINFLWLLPSVREKQIKPLQHLLLPIQSPSAFLSTPPPLLSAFWNVLVKFSYFRHTLAEWRKGKMSTEVTISVKAIASPRALFISNKQKNRQIEWYKEW